MKENHQNGSGPRRFSVLIAEDSAIMRSNLVELLASLEKFQVIDAVKDGAEACKSVQSSNPDVLILDIHMPRRGGLEVLRAVRKRKTSRCSVIVLTKFADEFYRKKCRELKADYFFDKLTEFDQFMEVLKTWNP